LRILVGNCTRWGRMAGQTRRAAPCIILGNRASPRTPKPSVYFKLNRIKIDLSGKYIFVEIYFTRSGRVKRTGATSNNDVKSHRFPQ
jgi:hypothetical protein